jgi:F-type H+-transporting ATPase subunit gamma
LASLRDLKRQIQSVKNISKVTDALQAVSAVKFRKAEARVKRARPYAENMEEMMRAIAAKSTTKSPMMVGRGEVRNVAVATLTADRGLCGGFNTQVVRRTMEFRREQSANVLQVASGRKGIGVFRFRRIRLTETYEGFSDEPTYEKAQEIGGRLTELFEDEEADEVYLVYNRFVNPAIQQPVLTRLLPIAPGGEELEREDDEERSFGADAPFEFIPGADEILADLIPRYVQTMIWQALLESSAGEHGARMTAMKNATDNANELVDSLTLQMNKARQAQITQEILEIVSGAEALAAS